MATILLHGRCPTCGYRNKGIRVGTARPGMRQLRMQAGALVFTPHLCTECDGPMPHGFYDQFALDVETTAELKAWQERQRAKRAERKRRVA